MTLTGILTLFLIGTLPNLAGEGETLLIKIGSKKFTESVILGELLKQIAESTGAEAEHRAELGGTRVLWNALRKGEIDIYP